METATLRQQPRRKSILSRLVLPLVLAAGGYLALALWGYAGELGASLHQFRFIFVAPVLALVLTNYGLRFARWHYFLGLGGARVTLRESAAVFLSGFSMSITPGRVGELMKSVLLRDEAGVAVGVSVPVVVADRANDVVAVAVLVAVGMVRFPVARGAVLVALAVIVGLLIVLGRSSWLAGAAARVFERRFARRGTVPMAAVQDAAHLFARLLRGRALLVGTTLGVLAWLSECLALYLVLLAFGAHLVSPYAATFVYALSTLAAAASFLPGGLGVTEVGMTALLVALGMARDTAVASVLVVRLCTLWFATGLGVAAYLLHRWRMAKSRSQLDEVSVALEVSALEHPQ